MTTIFLRVAFLIGATLISDTKMVAAIYKMKILQFIQQDPRNNSLSACKAATQLIVDTVNDRSDILPGYQIEMQFEEEGLSQRAPTQVMQFKRSFASSNIGYYESPIIIGPYLLNGNKAIGTFLHHINSVSISSVCGHPTMVNHKAFSNLYLTTSSSSVALMIARFIRSVGNWTKIAVVTSLGSVNDFSTADMMTRNLMGVGITMTYAYLGFDFGDDVFATLKFLDARVILAYMSIDVMVWKFLCLAFKHGMTGPRYAFAVNGAGFSDPYRLPDEVIPGSGCRRSVIIEQLKYTFWISPVQVSDDPNNRNIFAYNTAELDRLLDQKYLKGARPSDYEFREFCADATLKTLLSLDETDRKLTESKLSLRDYSDYPELVSKVLNDTVANQAFDSLRIGPWRYNKYGQVDGEIGSVGYWDPANGLRTIVWNKHIPGTDNRLGANYRLSVASWFHWDAFQGKPPNQARLTVTMISEVSEEVFKVVLSIAVVFGAFQLLALVVTFVLRKRNQEAWNTCIRSKCIGYVGCLVLDSGAIVWAANALERPYLIWCFRIVLLVMGLEVVFNVVSFRAATLAGEMKNYHVEMALSTVAPQGSRQLTAMVPDTSADLMETSLTNANSGYHSRRQNDTVLLNTQGNRVAFEMEGVHDRIVEDPTPDPLPNEALLETDKMTASCVIGLAILKAFVLAIWLYFDPLKCTKAIIPQLTRYNYETDTYTETWTTVCQSKYFLAWFLAITFFNALIIGVAIFCLYQIGLIARWVACPEHSLIKFATNNAAMLLVATVLVIVSVQTQVNSQIAIAFATLFMSAFSSFTWFLPLIREGFRRLSPNRVSDNEY